VANPGRIWSCGYGSGNRPSEYGRREWRSYRQESERSRHVLRGLRVRAPLLLRWQRSWLSDDWKVEDHAPWRQQRQGRERIGKQLVWWSMPPAARCLRERTRSEAGRSSWVVLRPPRATGGYRTCLSAAGERCEGHDQRRCAHGGRPGAQSGAAKQPAALQVLAAPAAGLLAGRLPSRCAAVWMAGRAVSNCAAGLGSGIS